MAKKTPVKKRRRVRSEAPPAAAGEVRIRMYRQGLGDCFLVTFGQSGGDDFHLVIDCGVLNGSPDGSNRVKQAVEDIEWETGGRLNLLVATHEHPDHLSGFNQAQELWSNFTIDKTWLAWTENATDPAVEQLKTRQKMRLRAALAGFTRMQSLGAGLAGEVQAKLAAQAESIRGLLNFSLDEDDDVAALMDPGVAAKKPSGPSRALAWLKAGRPFGNGG